MIDSLLSLVDRWQPHSIWWSKSYWVAFRCYLWSATHFRQSLRFYC